MFSGPVKLVGDVFNFELRDLDGSKINSQAFISDGMVMFKFSKRGIAKKNYLFEKGKGNIKVSYHERQDVYIEYYEGKAKDELVELVRKNFLAAGGKEK